MVTGPLYQVKYLGVQNLRGVFDLGDYYPYVRRRHSCWPEAWQISLQKGPLRGFASMKMYTASHIFRYLIRVKRMNADAEY